MIINHQYKFIFVKTRKTAGTSIEIALSQFCGSKDVITRVTKEDEETRRQLGFRGPQNYHVPIGAWRGDDWGRLMTRLKLAKYYNHIPAAMIRAYVGEEIWNSYYKFSFERDPFDKAISRYFWSTRDAAGGQRPPINEYLDTAPLKELSNWEIYAIDDHIAVDFMGRYESLDADLATIREKLGRLPGELALPNAKGGYRKSREHYSKMLDAKARARIEIVCAKEIAALGYRWSDAPE